jgi:hypothetical protein
VELNTFFQEMIAMRMYFATYHREVKKTQYTFHRMRKLQNTAFPSAILNDGKGIVVYFLVLSR